MGETRAGAALLDLRGSDVRALEDVYRRALACSGSVDAALALAVDFGGTAPRPGTGRTLALWESLATVAAADPTVARIVEPHLDALAILGELPDPPAFDALRVTGDSTWGVFAAEAPDAALTATDDGDLWRLSGRKPWCSLAGILSHALVTAHVGDARRLFAVDLRSDGVTVHSGAWFARGLSGVPSGPVGFDRVAAVPVGDDGWYLGRAGFAWGGIGVAAIWWGAAVGIARLVDERSRTREPDQIALMHLGAVDAALWAARTALVAAAELVDGGGQDRSSAGLLAARTRTVVAEAAESVIRRTGHALGPAPLALDERHAARVADLGLYLRQHHAERDEAAIGHSLLSGGPAW